MPNFTREEIARACGQAEDYLQANGAEKKEIVRLRLSLEETLLRYRDRLGDDAEFALSQGKRFGNIKIRLIIPGLMMDPFSAGGAVSEEERYLQEALVRMGKLPTWRYSHGRNVIQFSLAKKRLPEWARLSIAIAAAALCGFAVRFLPDAARITIQEDVVTPLMNTYLGFLNAIAGPMIFLSAVWGIYNIGDAATFSVLGKKLVKRYFFFLCLLVAATALLSRPFFAMDLGGAAGSGGASALFQMVLDIIPKNLFTPFTLGNTLQILFIAIIVGITMIKLSEKTDVAASVIEQLGFIINNIMSFVGKLVPLFVFGSLFNIVAGSDMSMLKNAGKFFFGTFAACLFALAMHTAITCIKLHCSPAVLWKKAISTFMIGLTTASSSAAFTDNVDTCREKFGIAPKLVNFAVPFGQIIFKPGNAVMYFFAAASVAESSGLAVSPSWLIMLLVMCVVLSSSTPPVPGGSTASFSILFVQLGLPAESLSIILALNVLLNYLRTATSLFAGQCVLADVAKDLGMMEGAPQKDVPVKK